MEWLNWIIAHFADIWEIVLILLGVALYVAKKNKEGLLNDVWELVKGALEVFAQNALQEVSEADVWAVAGPFWDNYLAGLAILGAFGFNRDKFLDFCWAHWQTFIDTEEQVGRAVARRMRVGSRAFNA